ncbi:hypothetical protein [Solimonas marina]|uniref:B box-type domain-containing protein n=1 Tax=Solimonas marina TaxID=2714601 RepID=A0A969W7A8_9GAMM|nr:hypothetical protein [Solimonas marina]NKF21209.1 hypothetical protein [Solimonas marina]
MHCFTHQDVEAVGVCKACYKGLCTQCASDLGLGLACKGEHEQFVEATNALLSRSIRISSINKHGSFVVPGFYAFLGAAFLLSGIITKTKASPFSIAMGCGFVVFAIITLVANRKAWAK